jgi:hypothetical protein
MKPCSFMGDIGKEVAFVEALNVQKFFTFLCIRTYVCMYTVHSSNNVKNFHIRKLRRTDNIYNNKEPDMF